jgi:RNA polymerase sigma-70 factor (ECF subfamily)
MTGITSEDFETVFKNWYEPIRNFLYYKSGDIDIAEDLAQDTFLKVWEKRDDIRPDTIKQYLYKISNNLFLNRIDHQRVQLNFIKNYNEDESYHGPDFDLEIKEFDMRLQKAISELNEKLRIVFLMNRIDKMTYNEIAESLGISVKTVEKRMTNALAILKTKIEHKL